MLIVAGEPPPSKRVRSHVAPKRITKTDSGELEPVEDMTRLSLPGGQNIQRKHATTQSRNLEHGSRTEGSWSSVQKTLKIIENVALNS